MALLTLLTDFGLADYYVAAVKGTILRLAPDTTLVDLSHEVPPGEIETGAFLIGACAGSFPAGTVHLAIVDPGVGSARRMLIARVAGSTYLAPDNGLLTRILGDAEVWTAERPDLYLAGPSSTFHGRDRFAPLAAALLRGEEPAALGSPAADPVRLRIEQPRREGRSLHGTVVHVDRFGNLVTDIPSDWLPAGDLRTGVGGHTVRQRASHYTDMVPGEPTLVPGSLGTAEVSMRGENLATVWRVRRGVAVRIEPERS